LPLLPLVGNVLAKNSKTFRGYTYLNNLQGSFATVIVNGVKLKMQTTISASGARYVGSGYTWWNKANEATLFKGTNLDTITVLDSCLEK
jgi:membrane-bound inhibitor of C-type lysozyme